MMLIPLPETLSPGGCKANCLISFKNLDTIFASSDILTVLLKSQCPLSLAWSPNSLVTIVLFVYHFLTYCVVYMSTMGYVLSWKFGRWDLRNFQSKTALPDYVSDPFLKCDISMQCLRLASFEVSPSTLNLLSICS